MRKSQETVGIRLRMERVRLGVSQADMAELGGVSAGSQHAYETDSNYPDIRYVANLLNAGVDMFYVIAGRHLTRDINGLAILEIVELIQQWAANREIAPSREQMGNFIEVFYDQFESRQELQLARYATTLQHAG